MKTFFYLLAQDGLGLATEALLLSVVTTLALREDRLLRLLVLRHLELLVLVAVRTVSPAGLRDVHLKRMAILFILRAWTQTHNDVAHDSTVASSNRGNRPRFEPMLQFLAFQHKYGA